MPRPKVYLETSFISYLVAKPSSDSERAMRQAYTLRWWESITPKTVRIVTQCGYECPVIITPKDYLEKINV